MGDTGATTRADQWGHAVRTASDDCVSAVNSFYHQVLGYGRNRAVILQAAAHDPGCVLANALAASFLSHQKPAEARTYLAAAASRLDDATSYEKAVFRAVSSLLAEQVDDDAAFRAHAELLEEYPKDLVSLKRAQLLCFYIGRPDLSLTLVEQVLLYNQNEKYIYGMLAFPLLELGRMPDAEVAAMKGFSIYKHDFWAQHNLCHVYQNDCRFKEAVDFMESCSPSWNSCSSFMYTHNWWHVAVCYLEGNSPLEKVLEVYDHCLLKELEKNDADRGEVYLNALGLLLRIFVRGQFNDIQDRVKTLASIFTNEINWHIEWLLDLLALWALVISTEIKKADDLLNAMKSRVYKMNSKKQQSMQKAILLAEALYGYGRGTYQKVYDLLGPDFDAAHYKVIGASDEQLDVFNEIWYTILLNTGHGSKAIEEIEKKVAQREGAPFLWRLLEKAYSMENKPEASIAAEKAKVLETAYFK